MSKNQDKPLVSVRTLHRILGTVIALFTLYFGITGTLIQGIDLGAVLSHAPATDPNIKAIRESIDGPPSFAVIDPADYDAPALPAGFDRATALATVMHAAQVAAGPGVALKYIELRMADNRPIGQVLAGDHLLRFDAATGDALPDLPQLKRRGGPESSQHLDAKRWHRMQALGDGMSWLNALVGLGLGAMIVSGLIMYIQLLRARRRLDQKALLWSAGGWWKTWHRGIALCAALFLSVVAVSGTLLSIDSFVLGLYRMGHGGQFPVGMGGDYSSPLTETALPPMLAATLAGYEKLQGDRPIKVLRLRTFSGMPQGVVVAGGRDTRQFVFNAHTGAPASVTEPGYPDMGFPFGWREHELMKQIHRGDIIGVPGRLMDLFAGLALIYLSASGLWMYIDLWRRRQKLGRSSPFWR